MTTRTNRTRYVTIAFFHYWERNLRIVLHDQGDGEGWIDGWIEQWTKALGKNWVFELKTITLQEKTRRDLVAAGYKEGPVNVFVKQGNGERKTVEFMEGGVKLNLELLCGIRILNPIPLIDPDEFYATNLGEPHDGEVGE